MPVRQDGNVPVDVELGRQASSGNGLLTAVTLGRLAGQSAAADILS
jgi:hypothetical protein